jgi:hypothetical protein
LRNHPKNPGLGIEARLNGLAKREDLRVSEKE